MIRTARRQAVRTALIALVLPFVATIARAQGTETERVSLGIAAGIANPWHGDFGFTAASWQADVRFKTGRFIATNVFFEQWRHSDEEVRTDVQITGLNGPIGHVDRQTSKTDHRTSVLGWNFLAMGRAGRVAFNGGGGISYLQYAREFTQTSTGCSGAATCGESGGDFNNSAFAAQLQAGVDVLIVPHVAGMAQFRMVVPIEDPGAGHHSFAGGVRILF